MVLDKRKCVASSVWFARAPKKDPFLSETYKLRSQFPAVNVNIDLKGPLTGTTRHTVRVKKGESLRVLTRIPKPGEMHKCMQFAVAPPEGGIPKDLLCFGSGTKILVVGPLDCNISY